VKSKNETLPFPFLKNIDKPFEKIQKRSSVQNTIYLKLHFYSKENGSNLKTEINKIKNSKTSLQIALNKAIDMTIPNLLVQYGADPLIFNTD
jgi:hypothetical protein